MALIRELQDHGCALRGSKICKYIKGDVTRCAACEYKAMGEEEIMQVASDFYISEGLMEGYPIVTSDEDKCGLCRGANKNKATAKAYAKITNKVLDVKRDLAGTGGRINGGEIDIEVPACKSCMKNLSKIKIAHYTLLVLITILAFYAIFALNLMYPTSSRVVSMFIFFGCCASGVGMYLALMRIFSSAIANKSYVNVLDLPALKGFKQKGFYVRKGGKVLPTLHHKPPFATVDELQSDRSAIIEAEKRRKRMQKMRET